MTGLTKVLEDISDAIYEDLLMILPWSVLFTVLVITALHRSAKVVVHHGYAHHDGVGHHVRVVGDHGHHAHPHDRRHISNFNPAWV